MGYSRSEMQAAFRHFNETAAHGGATGDWVPWSECFTEDATYYEHHYGHFTGRPEILAWITADRKSTRLNSSHSQQSRMPSSA